MLWSQGADCLEETFETRRSDDAHEPPGRLAEVAVGVRDAAGRKNRRALLGHKGLAVHPKLIFAFQDLERLVLPAVDVRGWTAARHVVGFDRADDPAGVPAVDADDHRNAEDVDLPASGIGDLDWYHKEKY